MGDPAFVPEDEAGKAAATAAMGKGNDQTARSAWGRRAAQWIWRNTDSITKWIQVVALVFAAAWTYLHFRETEAPAFETPAHVSADLQGGWRPQPGSGSCWLAAIFDVANQGVESFDVASLRVRVWRIALSAQPGGFRFIDVPAIVDRSPQYPPFADFRPNSPLIRHYPPKTDFHTAFTWIFYGPPSHDMFLTQLDVFDKSGHAVGQASSWSDQVCFQPQVR